MTAGDRRGGDARARHDARRRAGRARARAGRPARARHHRRRGRRAAAAALRTARRPDGDRQLRRLDRRRRRREQARAGARGQRRRRRQSSRARPPRPTCRCCTSPPTTCSTAIAPLDADGLRGPTWSPTPPARARCTARRSSKASTQVIAASPRHAIVRTAWLYGVDGPNFVDDDAAARRRARRRAGRHRPGRLADVVAGTSRRRCSGWSSARSSGLVHLTGGGQVSWNGFARGDLPPGRGGLSGAARPPASRWRARPRARPGRRCVRARRRAADARPGRTVWRVSRGARWDGDDCRAT